MSLVFQDFEKKNIYEILYQLKTNLLDNNLNLVHFLILLIIFYHEKITPNYLVKTQILKVVSDRTFTKLIKEGLIEREILTKKKNIFKRYFLTEKGKNFINDTVSRLKVDLWHKLSYTYK